MLASCLDVNHDRPSFAVASLRRWWEEMGKSRYPQGKIAKKRQLSVNYCE